MDKYLVTIDLKYKGAPDNSGYIYRSKGNTLGVFDNIEDAIKEGNIALEKLEGLFPMNPNCSVGKRLRKDRLLVTDIGYLRTPFEFYLEVTHLNHTDMDSDIDEVLSSIKEYEEWRHIDSSVILDV